MKKLLAGLCVILALVLFSHRDTLFFGNENISLVHNMSSFINQRMLLLDKVSGKRPLYSWVLGSVRDGLYALGAGDSLTPATSAAWLEIYFEDYFMHYRNIESASVRSALDGGVMLRDTGVLDEARRCLSVIKQLPVADKMMQETFFRALWVYYLMEGTEENLSNPERMVKLDRLMEMLRPDFDMKHGTSAKALVQWIVLQALGNRDSLLFADESDPRRERYLAIWMDSGQTLREARDSGGIKDEGLRRTVDKVLYLWDKDRKGLTKWIKTNPAASTTGSD